MTTEIRGVGGGLKGRCLGVGTGSRPFCCFCKHSGYGGVWAVEEGGEAGEDYGWEWG